MTLPKTHRIEYGDFQTPEHLASRVITFLNTIGIRPAVVVEPTCGAGSFIKAAYEGFGRSASYYAFDSNSEYLRQLQAWASSKQVRPNIICQNFFTQDWPAFFDSLDSDAILVLGNPPWVTNSQLGVLGSHNLPNKSNVREHRGLDAITGKANFDIAEWMISRLVECLHRNTAWLAMLCKMATARKVLCDVWKNRLKIRQASLHRIDAKQDFGVSVEACLLLLTFGKGTPTTSASVYSGLDVTHKMSEFGFHKEKLIANLDEYKSVEYLDGTSPYTWRSGVKHDAVKVMELTPYDHAFLNGFGECVDIEPDYLYPLLKSSDLGNKRVFPRKYVLLPQTHIGEDTSGLEVSAPKTWKYLMRYRELFERRKSRIYQKQPRFAIFGIGDYSFAPWKVAISGFYKEPYFSVVGSHAGKPVMVDNTCYFIPCASQEDAEYTAELLNSDSCQRFLKALTFSDAKRPITKDILQRIDLKALAEHNDRYLFERKTK